MLLPRRSDYAGLRAVVARRRRSPASRSASSRSRWRSAFGITTGLGAAGRTDRRRSSPASSPRVFGGSNVQVSGPTGAMTVVLVPIVARTAPAPCASSGVLAGADRARRRRRCGSAASLAYIPWPVIEGFTLGIAAIIFLQQVPAALGVAKPDGENTPRSRRGRSATRSARGTSARVGRWSCVVAVDDGRRRRAPPRRCPASLLAVVGGDRRGRARRPRRRRASARCRRAARCRRCPSISAGRCRDLLGRRSPSPRSPRSRACCRRRSPTAWPTPRAHDPDRELVRPGPRQHRRRRCSAACPRPARSPAPRSTSAPARGRRVAAIVHALVLRRWSSSPARAASRAIPLAALAGVLMVTAVRMVESHTVRAVLRATRSDALVLVAHRSWPRSPST